MNSTTGSFRLDEARDGDARSAANSSQARGFRSRTERAEVLHFEGAGLRLLAKPLGQGRNRRAVEGCEAADD